jgi:hypothetical protein
LAVLLVQSPAVLHPADTLDGRYEILACLAEGGMDAVYRARRALVGAMLAGAPRDPREASPDVPASAADGI